MIGLDQVATVYTPDATTGEYTTVDQASLACRLALETGSASNDANRAEDMGERLLMWGPDYSMPETAQVAVDGVRWNVQAGTLAAVRGPTGALVYRRCNVTRADT